MDNPEIDTNPKQPILNKITQFIFWFVAAINLVYLLGRSHLPEFTFESELGLPLGTNNFMWLTVSLFIVMGVIGIYAIEKKVGKLLPLTLSVPIVFLVFMLFSNIYTTNSFIDLEKSQQNLIKAKLILSNRDFSDGEFANVKNSLIAGSYPREQYLFDYYQFHNQGGQYITHIRDIINKPENYDEDAIDTAKGISLSNGLDLPDDILFSLANASQGSSRLDFSRYFNLESTTVQATMIIAAISD